MNTKYLHPQRFICHLKQLKSLKYLTINLTHLLQIPPHYIRIPFDSLKYLKNLSVLHFERKHDYSLPFASNIETLSHATPMINNLFKVQVKLSLRALKMRANEGSKLNALLEGFSKLQRLTSVDLNFLFYPDVTPNLHAIDRLKASKSLLRFFLTLHKCKNFVLPTGFMNSFSFSKRSSHSSVQK